MAEDSVKAERERNGDRVDPRPDRAADGGDVAERSAEGGHRDRHGRDQQTRDRTSRRNERVGTRAAEAKLDLKGRGAPRRGRAGGKADGDQDAESATPGDQTPRRLAEGSSGRAVRRRASGHDGGGDQAGSDQEETPDVGDLPTDHLSASDAARAGLRGLCEVIESQPVGVTQVTPMHYGWLVSVEVVELQRLPSSADILALYEAELDMDGTLRSYRRVSRYARGRGGSEDR